jgi:hypothetical protein
LLAVRADDDSLINGKNADRQKALIYQTPTSFEIKRNNGLLLQFVMISEACTEAYSTKADN